MGVQINITLSNLSIFKLSYCHLASRLGGWCVGGLGMGVVGGSDCTKICRQCFDETDITGQSTIIYINFDIIPRFLFGLFLFI